MNSHSYVAAVVEFATTPEEQLKHRLDQYVQFINDASAQDADIIVFPESTLNNRSTAQYVPYPEEQVIPCANNTYDNNPIQVISCAAQNGSTYVIINLTMKRVCSKERAGDKEDTRACPTDDLNLYNTNVVFDRTGKVISLYVLFLTNGPVFRLTLKFVVSATEK